MKKVAIFASGSGTNAENIIRYFKNHSEIAITLVLSNKPGAKVLSRAENLGVETRVFSRDEFYNTLNIPELLHQKGIDFIVLAGFLWLIPVSLINAYKGKIINIHPALLPKYGGKGMFGMKVHEAVVANNEKESGITIHHVNEEYDKGSVILQKKCRIEPEDTPEVVAEKVHQLEYEHFPRVIEKLLAEQQTQ